MNNNQPTNQENIVDCPNCGANGQPTRAIEPPYVASPPQPPPRPTNGRLSEIEQISKNGLDGGMSVADALGVVVNCGEDDVVKAVSVLLAGRRLDSPPTAMGLFHNEVKALEWLVYRAGDLRGWDAPVIGSEGMERLAMRLTTVLERFLDLCESARNPAPATAGLNGGGQCTHAGIPNATRCDLCGLGYGNGRVFADDVYQPSWCDCGLMLLPNGKCEVCDAI